MSVSGSTITYQVFDPAQGRLMVGSASGNTFDLINTNGVVSWSDGPRVEYRIYDPTRTNWMGGNVVFGSTSDLRSRQGVVAWSSGNTVFCRVYDPVRGAWMGQSVASGQTFDLATANGLVVWSSGATVHAQAYDPIRGVWAGQSTSSGQTFDLNQANGVVAWSSGNTVHYQLYDAKRTGWRTGSAALGATFDLQNSAGVVAWSSGNFVHGRVYDPAAGQWRPFDFNNGRSIADLRNQNGTLMWTGSSGQGLTAGYNPNTGAWHAGPTLPLSYFVATINAGNAPVFVRFIDMSIGGIAWSWNFGDGNSSAQQSPSHTYRGFGRYRATQTVSGASGSSSSSTNILTDISPPTGTLVINDGANLTTTNAVTLTLSATDNSGVVASNRFSNDGVSWSPWEPYRTTKNWTLEPGNGERRAFAQFKDAVDNVSGAVSDSITQDTTPLPTVMFRTSNTNISEAAGTINLSVILSAPFTRTVGVNYTTSNGTAQATSDYGAVNGRLTFAASETNKTFSLTITNDTLVELNETIVLVLSNASNAVLGPPATVTILDNDPPTVVFSNANFTVEEGAGAGTATATLNAASGMTVSIDYATANGTATPDADFNHVTGTLTFAPGQTTRSFTVPILNDTADENSETVLLSLSHPTNAILGSLASATLTILDDDAPTIRFASATYSVNESAGSASILVVLSKPYSETIFADYTTTDGGTAQPGSDYISANGTLIFQPGTTNKSFFVTILPDSVAEPNETIRLALSGFVNVSGGSPLSADLTIVDDDAPRLEAPRFTDEGLFQMRIIGPAGQRVSIEVSTDLRQWDNLTTLPNPSGSFDYTDSTAPFFNPRFYRAVALPP